MEKYLDQALIEYCKSDIYPFHMPGHKRQKLGDWSPEEIDITEIDGFDNLHHAEGILFEGQRRLAELSGADESFYLINGSTGGLLAAICGCVCRGDRILIGRNCHKAVYHAAYLMGLRIEYLYPEAALFGIQGSVTPEQVKKKLEQFPDTAAVVITSPTYDGVVSDIASLAQAVHEREIPLIVDEAHGAHFGYSDGFPEKAVRLGADLCIESLHKTLPSYTQTAALHIKRTGAGYRFNPERVKRYLGIFQSSSPSYVFMAGMDRCMRILQQDAEIYADPKTRPQSLFGKFEMRLGQFYRECANLRCIRVFPQVSENNCAQRIRRGIWTKDNSKILITAQSAGINGRQLYDILLNRYHLQMEMASGHYVTALTSIMDTEEGFARLSGALAELDREETERRKNLRQENAVRIGQNGLCGDCNPPVPMELYRPRKKEMELAEAMDADTETCLLDQAAGRISAEFIYLYPPGIPIIAPGELLTEQVIRQIRDCQKLGLQVQGMQDLGGRMIQAAAEKSGSN